MGGLQPHGGALVQQPIPQGGGGGGDEHVGEGGQVPRQHDHLRVEDIRQDRQGACERPLGELQPPGELGVPGVEAPAQELDALIQRGGLVTHRVARRIGRDQGLQPGAGLPTATPPAPALQALGLHGHVADLAGQAQPAAQEVAVGDDAGADPLTARQVEQVAHPVLRVALVGGQCGELGVVLQRDGGDAPSRAQAAGDCVADPVRHGDVVPLQRGGVAHGVIGVVDDPRLGQDDSRNRRPLLRQLLQGLGQHGCDVLDHRLGAVSGVVDELAAARDDLSGQVRDGQEQRGPADLQADAGRCARCRAQARARSADVAGQIRLLLDEQPSGAQLGHEGRDRRLG